MEVSICPKRCQLVKEEGCQCIKKSVRSYRIKENCHFVKAFTWAPKYVWPYVSKRMTRLPLRLSSRTPSASFRSRPGKTRPTIDTPRSSRLRHVQPTPAGLQFPHLPSEQFSEPGPFAGRANLEGWGPRVGTVVTASCGCWRS